MSYISRLVDLIWEWWHRDESLTVQMKRVYKYPVIKGQSIIVNIDDRIKNKMSEIRFVFNNSEEAKELHEKARKSIGDWPTYKISCVTSNPFEDEFTIFLDLIKDKNADTK